MSRLKYVRDNVDDEYGILELQDQILGIMVYIDQFCSENQIDYCLMAGSALGAERHKGFIPWDDDIDIYMTEDGYEKFRKCFQVSGNHEKYYLQEYGARDISNKHMITMAKVKLNHSEIKEKALLNMKVHQGVFVDIFILHNCASQPFVRKIQYVLSEAVVLKGLEIRGYVAQNLKDKVMLGISKILPSEWLIQLGLASAYLYQHKETEFSHGFIDTRSFSRAVYRKNAIFPGHYVDFETVKLKVPANNPEYLRIQFGDDYMTLPPAEKRQINKHSMGWRIGDDIVYTDFSDEKKLI